MFDLIYKQMEMNKITSYYRLGFSSAFIHFFLTFLDYKCKIKNTLISVAFYI